MIFEPRGTIRRIAPLGHAAEVLEWFVGFSSSVYPNSKIEETELKGKVDTIKPYIKYGLTDLQVAG